MMLTTKGRYAVMAIVDIAMQDNQSAPVSLADISERQGITVPYLEQIFARLRKAGVVQSIRGPGGGYTLRISKDTLSIAVIIDAIEESIEMTRCSSHSDNGCMKNNVKCKTHPLWEGLGNYIYNYLASITVADVCNGNVDGMISSINSKLEVL